MEEIWKDVPDYDGIYQVSNIGNVKNIKYGNMLSLARNLGYVRISVSKNGIRKNRTVHSLVMAAFVGPRGEGVLINHIDGNKANNNLYNLEYCSHSHNIKEDFRTGRKSLAGEKNNRAKLKERQVIKIRELRSQGKLLREIAPIYGVQIAVISHICANKYWKHVQPTL